MSKAYYNEFDPDKAEWLRELMKAGAIAPGEVDERSIADVRPDDLRGFTQCHFFAGIGVWSAALRDAGWGDERPVWTGSCPCPSFSSAGKGQGFDDPRHLWPEFYRLIRECRPASIFGEQVEAAIRHGWLDLVATDLESQDYAVGAQVLCSASVGGADIRHRLYWVAHAKSGRHDGRRTGKECHQLATRNQAAERTAILSEPSGLCATSRLAHSPSEQITREGQRGFLAKSAQHGRTDIMAEPADALKGYWRGADWLFCRDGKWRPVEAGTFPLAHGTPARLGRLRGYGDAINKEAAQAFIEAVMECI